MVRAHCAGAGKVWFVKMIQAVIFDMDGLMFDTERLWAPLWAPACRQLGLSEPTQAFLEGARGLAGTNMLDHIAAYWPGADPQQLLEAVWAIGTDLLARGVPVKRGLFELLDYLRDRGIPHIVASSSVRKMVLQNLHTTNAERYFTQQVCGDDVTTSKPDPEMFLKAAARLGLPPADCLVLEDSFNGVRASRAAGCVTVMVPDMLQPTDEIKALYNACCADLLQVRDLLAGARL